MTPEQIECKYRLANWSPNLHHHPEGSPGYVAMELLEVVDYLHQGLATAEAALVEQLEAQRITEAAGGPLQQLNEEIDRLRAKLAGYLDGLRYPRREA